MILFEHARGFWVAHSGSKHRSWQSTYPDENKTRVHDLGCHTRQRTRVAIRNIGVNSILRLSRRWDFASLQFSRSGVRKHSESTSNSSKPSAYFMYR